MTPAQIVEKAHVTHVMSSIAKWNGPAKVDELLELEKMVMTRC